MDAQERFQNPPGQDGQGSGVGQSRSSPRSSSPRHGAAVVCVQGHALDLDRAPFSPVRDAPTSSTRSLFLPYMVRPDLKAMLTLSSRRRSRGKRRHRIVCLYNRLVSAYNALSQGVLTTVTRSSSSQRSVGAASVKAIASALTKIRKLYDCLYGAAVTTESDLSNGNYRKTKLVKAVASRQALPERGLAATVSLESVVTPEIHELYSDPDNILLPESEWRTAKPTFNAFKGDEYTKLVLRGVDIGFMRVSSKKPMCVNGCFPVEKTAEEDRFICQSNQFNAMSRTPGDPGLPNPSMLGEVIVMPSDTAHWGSSDTSQMYNRLRPYEWIIECQGLPPLDGGLLGLEPGVLVWPRICALVMGWSHAVLLAQNAHENSARKALRIVQPSPALPKTTDSDPGPASAAPDPPTTLDVCCITDPPPHVLAPDRSLRLGYIDDEGHGATRSEQSKRTLTTADSALEKDGFPPKLSKLQLPDDDRLVTELVGIAMTVDGFAMPTPSSLRRLKVDTEWALSCSHVSPYVMSVLVGRWVWGMLLSRFTLCAFSEIFLFVRSGSRRLLPVPKVVKQELRMALRLLPMLIVDLKAQHSDTVFASDASGWGAGGVYAPISSEMAARMHRFSVGKGWNMRVDLSEAEQNRDGDPRLPDDLRSFIRAARWKRNIRHRWRWKDHITLQEGRAHLLQLEWLARQPDRHGVRQPFLVDSQAYVGAAVKGRSSSRRLLRVCRKAAAYFIFSSVRPLYLWIPTDDQPADEASRP